MTEVSVSRRFARFALALSCDGLPAEVADKLRAITYAHLVSGLAGGGAQRAVVLRRLAAQDAPKTGGACLLGTGQKAAAGDAALANCHFLRAAGMFDSYQMLSHPGAPVIACGLAAAEMAGRSGAQFWAAAAAGLEFACRLADNVAPTVAARGFRPSPVFSVMGAALTAATLMGLDEDGVCIAVAIAASTASGLAEAGSTGAGGAAWLQEPSAARQAMFAARMAASGLVTRASEHVIEGDAGFYTAFTGSNQGRLRYAFGPLRSVDRAAITDGLGESYRFLATMIRIYDTAGYNQPVIELLSEMMRQHAISAADVASVTVEMNYLETLYPSPEFQRSPQPPGISSTHFFAAHAIVHGAYPAAGQVPAPALAALREDAGVLRFMASRVRIAGVYGRPMFSPAATVILRDQRCVTGEYSYSRLLWDMAETVRRLEPCAASVPGGTDRLRQLRTVLGNLHHSADVAPVLEASLLAGVQLPA